MNSFSAIYIFQFKTTCNNMLIYQVMTTFNLFFLHLYQEVQINNSIYGYFSLKRNTRARINKTK